MVDKLLKLFSRMAGDGRAWKLKDAYTNSTVKAMLEVSKNVREVFRQIPKDAYPWTCSDEAIPYWEAHFGIAPQTGSTIEERRRTIVTEYTAIGSNAAEYLEFILSSNDYSPEIIENLDGVDLGHTWDVTQFKIANGIVATYETPFSPVVYKDPVEKPTTQKQWRKVYIILDTFDNVSVNLLRSLILRYSSSHTVAMLINNDPNSTIIDAELINEITPGNWVVDAELANGTNEQLVIDAELQN